MNNNAYKLPDSYAKDKGSNNYKLLNLNEQAVSVLKKDMEDVLNSLDIMKATGKTLDLYGDMVGQKRGGLNDLAYRYMILTKIGINITQGSYDSVIAVACQIFECEASDIILDDAEDACKVTLTKFPLTVLVNAGFSSTQAVQMIDALLPIGVKIGSSNFEGSFEFAETYGEYDENAGFGDIAQTIGGWLGLLADTDAKETILPL